MPNLIGIGAASANTRSTVQIRQISKSNHIAVLGLTGRLDATTANQLQASIEKTRESGSTHVLLNFKNLEYISSAGLGVLLSAAKDLQYHGGDLLLCELRDNVRKVFEVSGFTRIFYLYPTEKQARDDLA